MAPFQRPPPSRSSKPTPNRKITPSTITSRKHNSIKNPTPFTPSKIPASSSTLIPPKSLKSDKPQKAIFKGLTLSIAGTITDTAGNIISHESIVKWWTLHGGMWDREVSAETTHMICSIEEYKRQGPPIKKAFSFFTKEHQCHIVVFEWLEDCLLGPKGQKKKRAEKGYTLDRTINRLRLGKKNHDKFRARFEDGLRASKELCDNKLHKVYFDRDGFEYKIMLTRLDLSNGKPRAERYTLFLFESLAKPHTYMTGAKLSRTHRPTSFYRETCRPKPFPEAFHDFQHFFHDKTQISWDDRLESFKRPGAFVYTPPVFGRPVGWVSEGKGAGRRWVGDGNDEGEEKDGGDVVYDTDSEVNDDYENSSGEDTAKDLKSESSTSDSTSSVDESSSVDVATEVILREPIRHVSDAYGYQPDIVDLRFPPKATVVGSAKSSFTVVGDEGSGLVGGHQGGNDCGLGFEQDVVVALANEASD